MQEEIPEDTEKIKNADIIKELVGIYIPHTIDQIDLARIISSRGMGSPQYVWGSITPGSPTLKLTYDYGGILIQYYKRVTTHRGDTDTFLDYSISVDGVCVVDTKYAYYIR